MPNILIFNNEDLYQLLLQAASALPSCTIQNVTELTPSNIDAATILLTDAINLQQIKNINQTQVICFVSTDDNNNYPGCTTITKPYHIVNLIEEMQRLLSIISRSDNFIKIGSFLFDPIARQLTKTGTQITLTEKEAKLVMLLYSCGGQISRDEILKQLWGYEDGIDTHTVETHIYRIRQKTGKSDDFIGNNSEGYFLSKSLI